MPQPAALWGSRAPSSASLRGRSLCEQADPDGYPEPVLLWEWQSPKTLVLEEGFLQGQAAASITSLEGEQPEERAASEASPQLPAPTTQRPCALMAVPVVPVLACPSSFARCQRPQQHCGLLSPAERGWEPLLAER